VFAGNYNASDAKASSIAEACSKGPNIRDKFNAVVVYLRDLNTRVEY
jgi:hypothetical protein